VILMTPAAPALSGGLSCRDTLSTTIGRNHAAGSLRSRPLLIEKKKMVERTPGEPGRVEDKDQDRRPEWLRGIERTPLLIIWIGAEGSGGRVKDDCGNRSVHLFGQKLIHKGVNVMLIGAGIAGLLIVGLFLEMLSSGPKQREK
jgi:hypothetical protein